MVSESTCYEQAMEALARGDYTTALRELKPLAEHGDVNAPSITLASSRVTAWQVQALGELATDSPCAHPPS